jgi:hypothetical protein
LGLLIARGIHVASIFPLDGSRKLEENPFAWISKASFGRNMWIKICIKRTIFYDNSLWK